VAEPNGIGQSYKERGYVTALDLFSREEIEGYRQCFDALEAKEGKESCQIGLQARHFDEEFIWSMAADSRIIDLMASVMGDDILLLSTHFFCKYPDPDGVKFVAWHQDVTYWGLEPPEAHTAWVAIDDSDVENGCMQIIPCSHTDGIVTHGTSNREGNLLSINQEIPDEYVDKSSAVDIELKAGQISIHDGKVYHASHSNRSDRRRCGLTLRFIPPEARQKEANSMGGTWKPMLVRGEDRYHHYPETPAPF
jgi:ectoine hydroxylase-related dioxygenase (phytanoyl-CoA dioxygenase family)